MLKFTARNEDVCRCVVVIWSLLPTLDILLVSGGGRWECGWGSGLAGVILN